MPCLCWIDDGAIEPEMKVIRDHMKEIVKHAKIANAKGDLYPKSGPPIPRDLIQDIHQLLDDLWTEKCQEARNDNTT